MHSGWVVVLQDAAQWVGGRPVGLCTVGVETHPPTVQCPTGQLIVLQDTAQWVGGWNSISIVTNLSYKFVNCPSTNFQ